jgi:cytochrome-b5 reductase
VDICGRYVQLCTIYAELNHTSIELLSRLNARRTNIFLQSIRTYATESPAPKSSNTPYIVATAAAGAGIFGYNFLGNSSKQVKSEAPPSQSTEDKKDINASKETAPGKTFTGGDQGFVDLKLTEIIPYNHNTKRFKFALPDPEHVSGLNVACKSSLCGDSLRRIS